MPKPKARNLAPDGTPDELTPDERYEMASHTCDLCWALLLLTEVGPHFRLFHPTEKVAVTPRM